MTQATMRSDRRSRRAGTGTNITRIVVGVIWLGGALFNLLVTSRMKDPFGWIADATPLPPYQWFFGEIVSAHPVVWTVLLALGEATLGALTLARGGWARLGLLGGALFSTLLFSFLSPYTLVMGAYAALLAWLARHDFPRSPIERLTAGVVRSRGRQEHAR